MRRAFVLGALVLSAVVTLMWATTTVPAQDGKAAAKWEYKVIDQPSLDKAGGLEKAGTDGWELVAVESEVREANRVNAAAQGLITNITVRQRTYYFKRAK